MVNKVYNFKLEREWMPKFYPKEGTILKFLGKDFDKDTVLNSIYVEEIGLPVKEEHQMTFVMGDDNKFHQQIIPVNS